MKSLYRVCIAAIVLSILLYIRSRLAGLIYRPHNVGTIPGVGGGLFVSSEDKTGGTDSYGDIFRSIVKSLEEGDMSSIERVDYSGEKGDKIVVLGKLRNQSASWIEAELPEYVCLFLFA